MSRLLLSLWLLGAALITGSTLIAMNAVFGWTDGVSKIDRSATRPSLADTALPPPPASDASTVSTAPPPLPELPDSGAGQSDFPKPPALEMAEDNAGSENDDNLGVAWARVAKAANLRAGPSSSAARLSSFASGTELRVLAQEKGWIQVADGSGSQTGWIYEKLLEPIDETGSARLGGGHGEQGDTVRVLEKSAIVRAGPSEEAAMLFGFPYGRELRVLSREAGFAEIVDLRSGATGWISEDALQPSGATQEMAASRGSSSSSAAGRLPYDEEFRGTAMQKPPRRSRMAKRNDFFSQAIRRGLGGR